MLLNENGVFLVPGVFLLSMFQFSMHIKWLISSLHIANCTVAKQQQQPPAVMYIRGDKKGISSFEKGQKLCHPDFLEPICCKK